MLFRGTLETVRKQNELINNQKTVIVHKDAIIDNVIKDDGLYSLRTIGKMLKSYTNKMGANKIFEYMRIEGMLFDNKGYQNHNLPYDKYSNYFEIKRVEVDCGGFSRSEFKTYFNGKGLKWFLNKLAKKGVLTSSQKDSAIKEMI